MENETPKKPNPGSQAAQDAGCTCAVIDNHHGRGIPSRGGGVEFWVDGDCPLHGLDALRQETP